MKLVIWAVALGSGDVPGGVLAPLLMMGGALGGVEAMFLPTVGTGFWPLISMGAILGGTMRSPFTGIVFLRWKPDARLQRAALTVDRECIVCLWGDPVLLLKRSILTEKLSRRELSSGSREYSVDPLEILFRSGGDAYQCDGVPESRGNRQ